MQPKMMRHVAVIAPPAFLLGAATAGLVARALSASPPVPPAAQPPVSQPPAAQPPAAQPPAAQPPAPRSAREQVGDRHEKWPGSAGETGGTELAGGLVSATGDGEGDSSELYGTTGVFGDPDRPEATARLRVERAD